MSENLQFSKESIVKDGARMNKDSKVLIMFLVVLLLTSLSFNYISYRISQEKNDNYTIYINDFYYELNDAISELNSIIEGENKTDLHKEFSSLTKHLSKLDYMVGRVPYYIDGMGGLSNYIGTTLAVLNRGTSYKGDNIPPFIEDHKLNQQEIAYLSLLLGYLVTINEELISEETGQLSEHITKTKFQDIISEHIFDFGKEDELLEEYIKYNRH